MKRLSAADLRKVYPKGKRPKSIWEVLLTPPKKGIGK